jgi:rubrerythrin
MKFYSQFLLIIVAGLFVYCSTDKPKKSLEDLKAAFNTESTSGEKYARYARKAEAEGFDTIAQLFEAASRSENIHAFNHSKILEKLGESINTVPGDYDVKNTEANLKSAILSETHEMQTMYPAFIRNAEREKVAEAAKSFTWAWDGGKKHLKYYRNALLATENGKQSSLPFTWYVCPACGNIYNDQDVMQSCDLCLTKQERFIGYPEKKE